ncbi:TPA: DUF551 domain-containing protein [Enterobacter hormaechei]|uniref:DUF551 domain-containing protein n=1 Tax=Enterobacter hormaechei TaxID=158836 RepID=UPI0007359001|nr:DUF551 domain-containing protein [Enterobacter hormaechei]KTJ57483.1 hypothetical protein ASU81_01680 [Enterobacter hormaechei subsp. steigerwaltii]MBW7609998.1 DUF551 domain-containing protein [Enterobacter hormaechei]HAS9375196.1 DUF551 domain-containing protein [Enterobacter hormaechei]HAV1684641.1 DUF551 domain-containing protein [Enterobacter hormaechei subsp. steigerwaltii]HCD6307581.1 DUF551 domain-containing protein [Enterobacter hormaechei]
MITLTKEWLLKTIAELEEERDATPGAVNEDAVMALEAMKLALASLEAEPAISINIKDGWPEPNSATPVVGVERLSDGVHELYTAPPAPTVPDKITSANAAEVFEIAAEAEHLGLRGAYASYAVGWNACRAAMLQGAEPVSNRDELPDGWMACSERMPEQYDYEIWTYSPTKGVNHSLGYDGHARTFSDVDYYSTIDDVTHWMPITRPAAPRQETK